jgi:putative aldouronate transport system substrate-binding protein
MKKNQKIVCAAVAAISMVAALSGCKAKPSTATNTPEPQKLSEAKLTWYYVGNGQQKDNDEVEAELNKYLKDKINASVKMNVFDWGSYDQKLKLMIASNEEFDICFTSSWTNNYTANVARGAFVELDTMMDKVAPKLKQVIDPAFFNGIKVNEKVYAVPTNKELPHQWGVLLQKKYVDKYNIDVEKIKSYKDLEAVLQVIKEKEPSLYPMDHGFVADLWDNMGVDNSPGVVKYDTTDFKVFNKWETPEMASYLQDMRRWYQAGYFRRDVLNVKDFNADMNAGKVFASSQSLKPGKDAEMTRSSGIEWVQAPLYPAYASTRDTQTAMQAISINSKNQERALMFLELLNTDKYVNNLVNFGIENKHYVKKSDNVIDFPAGVDAKSSTYNPGISWAFANQFINYLWSNEDPKKWDNYKQFNSSAIVSKAMGFNFDSEPVKNELAACAAVRTEFEDALTNGVIDPADGLSKMISKLKAAGADKVIAEQQKQLDQWRAKK